MDADALLGVEFNETKRLCATGNIQSDFLLFRFQIVNVAWRACILGT
jgi:hypothetical protein